MNEGPLMTIAFKRLYVGFSAGYDHLRTAKDDEGLRRTAEKMPACPTRRSKESLGHARDARLFPWHPNAG
jgi:hypothetical protein